MPFICENCGRFNTGDINMRLITVRNGCIFLMVFYTVGLLGLAFRSTRDLFTNLVSINILLSSALLFLYHQDRNFKGFLILLTIGLCGFLVEIVGVNTGLLFGNYSYGTNLGFKLAGTPLLIGLNWLVLIYCMMNTFDRIKYKWYFPFVGSAGMVIFDLVMEPVAVRIGMWEWENGSIPVSNYVTWFLVSLLMFSFLFFLRVDIKNSIARCLLLVQLVFFIGLNIILRY